MNWEFFFNTLKKAHLKSRRMNEEGSLVYKLNLFVNLLNTKNSACGYYFEARIDAIFNDKVVFLYNMHNEQIEIPYKKIIGINMGWQKEIIIKKRIPHQIEQVAEKIRSHQLNKVEIKIDCSEIDIPIPTSNPKKRVLE